MGICGVQGGREGYGEGEGEGGGEGTVDEDAVPALVREEEEVRLMIDIAVRRHGINSRTDKTSIDKTSIDKNSINRYNSHTATLSIHPSSIQLNRNITRTQHTPPNHLSDRHGTSHLHRSMYSIHQ